jgi:hypothetical protein
MDAGLNCLEVPVLDLVRKDAPFFAKDGVIKLTYMRGDQQKIIKKVTDYLVELFQKEGENVDNHSKHESPTDPGRDQAEPLPGTVEESQGERPGGVHNSRGGRELPHGGRGRKQKAHVAEGGNKADSESSEARDKAV